MPPVILLGSELNLIVMTGDWSGSCEVGLGGGDEEAEKNSGIFPEKNLENFASLGNVAAFSREAKLGFDWTNPPLTIPTRFSSSTYLETTSLVLS